MIFVTVGTHEQPFDRLLKEMDRLVKEGIIQEEVIVQSGYCTYVAKHCKTNKMIPYAEMQENMERARIIITHGGPATFIMPLQYGKTPIVVPRQAQYDEHVNNHQLDFAKEVEKRMGNIIVVENIADLQATIQEYDQITAGKSHDAKNHNEIFMKEFGEKVDQLFVSK